MGRKLKQLLRGTVVAVALAQRQSNSNTKDLIRLPYSRSGSDYLSRWDHPRLVWRLSVHVEFKQEIYNPG